ncbi:hypothetical protein CUJ83_06840 [Methanocella sp. CWC-04]|uniref:Uncharacterized protein n=1 Tax=Methanooceanicella nereidis TaxID=2052831 RepID=A0AAP2RC91_9EURY|nr:hypothetical protein [Methanocella sp. CWC-04]MCD1294713.1 hypothetical protein [Methanocella sp. CWC-04]
MYNLLMDDTDWNKDRIVNKFRKGELNRDIILLLWKSFRDNLIFPELLPYNVSILNGIGVYHYPFRHESARDRETLRLLLTPEDLVSNR